MLLLRRPPCLCFAALFDVHNISITHACTPCTGPARPATVPQLEQWQLKFETKQRELEEIVLQTRRAANQGHSTGVTTYEDLACLVREGTLHAPRCTDGLDQIMNRVSVQHTYGERDVLAFASPKSGATYQKHEGGKRVWGDCQQEDPFRRFAQLAHEVWRAHLSIARGH